MSFIDSFVDWAHFGLLQIEEAQSYLLSRGVSSSQWTKHKLGYVISSYSPDPSLDLGHSSNCLKQDKKLWCDSCRFIRWSSVWEGEEGSFKTQFIGKKIIGSVVFPLTSYSGRVTGFQTRSILEKKFDSFSILRRPDGYFFGIAPNMTSIWSRKKVFVVEGPFDQLVFERLVNPNVIGLTTNVPNSIQTRFFHRFVNWIGLFLDMDKAGRDGVLSFRHKLPDIFIQDFKISGLKKSNGDRCKDLNEAWVSLGDQRFTKYLSELIERNL
jgi:5S rRNA maturation endonuclease (ribonuclease M5)